MKKFFDVIVIGSGPGGQAVAQGLKSRGMKVAIVEKDKWGGTCPNYGCDPTKILMAAAELKQSAQNMKTAGIEGSLTINWQKLMARKNAYTVPFSKRAELVLHNSGIETLYGEANFTAEQNLRIESNEYEAKYYIIATGQKPKLPDINGKEFLKTSNDFLNLEKIPEQMVFLGTGFVALELAQIANAAGCKVTLISRSLIRIKGFDQQMVMDYIEELKAEGIQFIEEISISEILQEKNRYRLTDHHGYSLTTDYVVAATGREPNIEALHLENVAVNITETGIKVNERLQTSHSNIYALGDVIDKAEGKLTPVASYEAHYLIQSLTSKKSESIQYPLFPTIIFGATKLAKIGKTEGSVKDLEMTTWYTYKRVADPKARIKIFTNKHQQIVGAVVLSTLADELINLFEILINKKMNVKEIQNLIMAYPTVASDLIYFY